MRAEAAHDPGASELRWLLGALGVAARARLRSTAGSLSAGALLAAMLAIDWTSGAALPAVLLAAGAAALLAGPGQQSGARATLVAGGLLPLAHALAHVDRALWPWYQFAPFRMIDWLIVAALFVPAWLGVRIGRAAHAFALGRERV